MPLLNKLKPIALLLLLVGYLAMTIVTSLAADQTITCVSGGCSGLQNSLFDELSVAPGDSVTKSIEIINKQGETMKLAMSVSKNDLTDDDFTALVDVTVITDGANNRFTGSLESFLTSYIDLEKLEDGRHRLVEITLSLPDVGNEYQGKQAKFSFDVKIDQEVPGSGDTGLGGAAASSSPSPSPSPSFTPLRLSAVAGAATSAPSPFSSPSPATTGTVKGKQTGQYWPWLFSLIPLGWFGRFLYKRRRLR